MYSKMGYETDGRGTNTCQKDHGDNGGVINAIIIFDENDPQPRVIQIDPADFIDISRNIQIGNVKNWSQKSTDLSGTIRIGNTNNWPQKPRVPPGNIRIGNANNWSQNCNKYIQHVYVADEATTTEVTDVTTNTDALIANAAVVTDINNGDRRTSIEREKTLLLIAEEMLSKTVKTTEINTDITYKPVGTITDAIHVADKGIGTDATIVNEAILSTNKYIANKATKTELLNKEISTNTKWVNLTKDIKGTSKVTTIKAPASVSAASSAYIQVDIECKAKECTDTRLPRTADLSIDTNLIPHRVHSNPKLVFPKYTDMREAAVKAVFDFAAIAEKVVTPKVDTKEAVKNIATEPDKNVKIATKNVATMFVADSTVSPNGRVVKTKRKSGSYYPSPAPSSSGDSTAHSCYIIYSSTTV